MKGVILAGGTGSRMFPCTKVTNKNLLPVYNKPMIYYPLLTLASAGIKDIMVVSGRGHAGDFVNLLGSGKEFGVKISYEVQEEAGGISQALSLAEDFVGNDSVVVILGDNIFEDNVKDYIKDFEKQERGARIFLKEVGLKAAKRFGIALIDGNKVVYVEEKPQAPKSNLAMTGLYMFDSKVFDIIKNQKPSARGEIEITDTIDYYVKENSCYYDIIKGFWSDAGTFESLNRASNFVRQRESSDDDYWSDSDEFIETFKFPSKDDNISILMEKLSQLSKKQSEILEYISKKQSSLTAEKIEKDENKNRDINYKEIEINNKEIDKKYKIGYEYL